MMSIRWPSYLLILITALLGLVIPLLLPQLWRLGLKKPVRPASAYADTDRSPEYSSPIAIRFHLAVLLFVGFLGLAILLIPLLFSIQGPEGNGAALVLSAIAIPMLIILFYCLRKGDLSWNTPKSREAESTDQERLK